jgi:IrrE N-terminal-like domain
VPVATTYEDPRAHAVRERYLGLYGGEGVPVPVEAIAEDLLGLRIEESWDIDCSGMLLPAKRRVVLNAKERVGGRNDPPLRRFRFTIAHEIGHWVCHCLEGRAESPKPSYCRPVDLTGEADRTLEREANVFAAELLMPERTVREAWEELGDATSCAVRFDVSPTAMQWRLYAFGLLPDKPADFVRR